MTEWFVHMFAFAEQHRYNVAMDGEVLDALDPGDVDVLIEKIAAADAAFWAEKVSVVQAVLRRRLFEIDGSTSVGDWVAERFRLSARSARLLCRVARRLIELPELQGALEDGELDWEKVVALSRFVTPDNVEDWIADAAGLSVDTLEACARRHWAEQRRKNEEEEEKPEPDRNCLRYFARPDSGRVSFWGDLVGDDACRFLTVIDHIARNECEPGDSEERDPWEVRCGDALAIIIGAALGGLSRDRATVNVHLDAEAWMTGGAEGEMSMMAPFEFGLTPTTLERLLCDARLRLVFDDDSGTYVTHTDAAHPPPAMEQAVLRRDVHCVIKGCRRRHGQIHHIVWRSKGGLTRLSNLVFVCWHHHRLIHDHGWKLTGQAGALTWRRPDGSIAWQTGPPRLAA